MNGSAIVRTRVFWNANKRAKVVGRTMDLGIDDNPLMVIYPRGLERDGKAGDNSLKLKAKYGSVAMTASGVAADDGINEHGLAAHMINLPDTEYEVRDNRSGIGNLLCLNISLMTAKPLRKRLLASTRSRSFPSSSKTRSGLNMLPLRMLPGIPRSWNISTASWLCIMDRSTRS